MPESRLRHQTETAPPAEQPQLCKIMSGVFAPRPVKDGGRYCTGLVVETPDGRWLHRVLPVEDWPIVPEGKGLTPKQLGALKPHLVWP